jgi:hypothetical protein
MGMQSDKLPKIDMPTQIRVEAAKARLKLGEARLLRSSDGDVYLEAIQDKDGIVILDYDY